MRSRSNISASVALRREQVRQLSQLPLNQVDIAEILGVQFADVKNDRDFLRRKHGCAIGSGRANIPYSEQLQTYASAINGRIFGGFSAEIQEKIARRLATNLRIHDVQRTINAMYVGMSLAMMPVVSPKYRWPQRILDILFPRATPRPLFAVDDVISNWLMWFEGTQGIMPNNHSEFAASLFAYRQWSGAACNEQILCSYPPAPQYAGVIAGEATEKALEAAFSLLTGREQEVMNRWINRVTGAMSSFAVVGEAMGFTSSRAQQIHCEAKEKLKIHLLLNFNIEPVSVQDEDVARERKRRRELRKLRRQVAAQNIVKDVEAIEAERCVLTLLRSVDEFVWSKRVKNAFKKANILWMWQLCEKSPAEVLDIPGIREVGLKVIENVLSKTDAFLGMTIQNAIKLAKHEP